MLGVARRIGSVLLSLRRRSRTHRRLGRLTLPLVVLRPHPTSTRRSPIELQDGEAPDRMVVDLTVHHDVDPGYRLGAPGGEDHPHSQDEENAATYNLQAIRVSHDDDSRFMT